MKEPNKEWMIILYLWWALQFLFCLSIACVVCLIATAAISKLTVMEGLQCALHLINV